MAANPPTTVLQGDIANPPHNFTHPQPFIRSPYNYDVKAASEASASVASGVSMTVQSMAEDADLNIMLKRFGVTGKMPENVHLPTYGDFSQVTDFQSAMNAIIEADDNFMELPADVRARFNNNPQLLLDFCSDPGNISEVRKIFGEKNVPQDGQRSVQPTASGSSASQGGTGGAASGDAAPVGSTRA